MTDLLQHFARNARRGSKPRCHFLTHGPAPEVAARLTALAAPFAVISAGDCWMPDGFIDVEEAQLHRAARLLDPVICASLSTWWLAPASRRAKTPNFDIASTCTIEGRRGLLLVEAKAHDQELEKEAAGRLLTATSSDDRRASHKQIALAIASAREGLERATSLPWHIGRDTHYQMSNRFAWAWKLTELGLSVVLIYLGFLCADEMSDQGQPFQSADDWEQCVRRHSAPLFPEEIWERPWTCNDQRLVPLIRSVNWPLVGHSEA